MVQRTRRRLCTFLVSYSSLYVMLLLLMVMMMMVVVVMMMQ